MGNNHLWIYGGHGRYRFRRIGFSIYKKNTNRVLSFLLGITAGFMLFIVTFHLLPESFILGGVFVVIIGILLGILLIIFIENNIEQMVKTLL